MTVHRLYGCDVNCDLAGNGVFYCESLHVLYRCIFAMKHARTYTIHVRCTDLSRHVSHKFL